MLRARVLKHLSVLVAAAVCPHPPVLVPEAAGCAAAELDSVRAACDVAVAALVQAEPDLIVTVGGAAQEAEYGAAAAGSLADYGVAWRTGDGTPVLPLSLTIGRWLLERAGLPGEAGSARHGPGIQLLAVAFDASPDACLLLGAQLAARAPSVALLAMGDGSARRSEQAPGYLDPQAQPYDDAVTAALARADAPALTRLGPGLSADLLVAGRAAWQVLAGAAGENCYEGRVLFAGAPYGVCYLVASWLPPAPPLP